MCNISYAAANRDKDMAIRIAQKVSELGGSTYYVGGFCRDQFVSGIVSKDIDIEIFGVTVEQLRNILDTLGEREEHGKSFGVFGLKGYTLDIALPRKERCTGNTHTDFDVTVNPYMTTYEAARRRDLTMNAIMINVLTKEVVDHFNGCEDIENGIIRHIDDTTFVEDPLRVLRVAQFASRFTMEVAPETLELCKSMDITTLSKERVYTELEKALLKSPVPSVFFKVLRSMNQLEYWFTELNSLIGLPQNPMYHPEGDVWEHTMQVLEYAAICKNHVYGEVGFLLAAICHDMGKIVGTTIDEDGSIHAYGHAKLGEPLVRQFLNRFTDNKRLIDYVVNLSNLHMDTHQVYNGKSRIKKTNHLFDKCLYPKDLIYLTKCDTMGKLDYVDANEELDWLMERYEIYEKIMAEPHVRGEDLISNGLKPGPYFADLMSFAHKLRLAGITKEDALHQVLMRSRKVLQQNKQK